MKTKNSLLGTIALALLPALLLISCNKDPIIVDQETKITGKASLQAGTCKR